MLLNEGLQNGNQVVVADQRLAVGIHIGRLDFAVVIQHQLVGKAVALGVGGTVLIRVNHILKIVDHGLRNHHRLLALGQIDGLGEEAAVAVHTGNAADEAVEIHQHIVGSIKLIQNPGELLHGDKVLVVRAGKIAGHILVAGSGGIGHQHMEGEIGDGGDILQLHQLLLLIDQLCLLGRHLLGKLIVGAAVGVQQCDGALVIVAHHHSLRLGNQPLKFLLCDTGSVGLLLGFHLGGGLLVLLHRQCVGYGADDEAENQKQRCAGDDGRKIDLLEDAFLLPLFPADKFGVQRIEDLFIFELGHRLHIHIQELGERALFCGLRRFRRLFLFALAAQLGKAQAALLLFADRGIFFRIVLSFREIHLILGILLLRRVFLPILAVDPHIIVIVSFLLRSGMLREIGGQVLVGIIVLAGIRILVFIALLIKPVCVYSILLFGGCVLVQNVIKIKIFILRHKILRIEAVFFFKIEIDIEIVLVHARPLPLW